jgi:hypothetical protein
MSALAFSIGGRMTATAVQVGSWVDHSRVSTAADNGNIRDSDGVFPLRPGLVAAGSRQ